MRIAFAAVVSALLLAPVNATESKLDQGVRQYEEGLLAEAVVTLDSAIRELAGDPSRRPDVVRAHLYKGAAFVGLLDEEQARAAFREALGADPSVRLRKGQFPDRVLRVFEATRSGKSKSVMERPSDAPKKAGIGGATLAIIAASVVAAGGAAVAVAGPTDPGPTTPTSVGRSSASPTLAAPTVSPDGTGIQGVTRRRFTAAATDPDGDPLTYTWTFEEGGPATGPSVERVFNREGTSRVTVTVSDGRGGTATASVDVLTRNLTGEWRFQTQDGGFLLTQSGEGLGGRVISEPPYAFVQDGVVSDPRQVSFSWYCPSGCAFQRLTYHYDLAANSTLERLQGTERGVVNEQTVSRDNVTLFR